MSKTGHPLEILFLLFEHARLRRRSRVIADSLLLRAPRLQFEVGPVTLQEWHNRLNAHFLQIRCERASSTAKAGCQALPTFALEHGLDIHERKSLADDVRKFSKSLRDSISLTLGSRPAWLPWIVYAAELGYEFDGGEYWQTFESETPGWRNRGDRHWLRERFQDFEYNYDGAQPKGHWAEAFTIICWPITHAIVPRDLQVHLARALYQASPQITSSLLRDTEKLGGLIQMVAEGSSDRFQQFTTNHLVVGYVAAALLLKDLPDAPYNLETSATYRITTDVESHLQARSWLKQARETVSPMWHTRPLAPPVRPQSPEATFAAQALTSDEDQRAVSTTLVTVQPEFVLRRVGPRAWAIAVKIPDLSHLLAVPGWAAPLRRSSSFVAGSDRRLAPGRFIHGTTEIALVCLPTSKDAFLRFDGQPPERATPPGVQWLIPVAAVRLFRVGKDDVAREVRTKIVRSGWRYIIISEQAMCAPANTDCTVPVKVEGAKYALEIDLRRTLSKTAQEFCKALGLNQTHGISVWPAGVPPISWDDESRAEWLSTDTPTIGMAFDFQPKGLSLVLRDLKRRTLSCTDLRPVPDAGDLFVQLPRLPSGSFYLDFTVESLLNGSSASSMHMEINIRDPQPWCPEQNGLGALSVFAHPEEPTLEEFWDGKVQLDVLGPPERVVELEISMYDASGADALVKKKLPRFKLPMDPTRLLRDIMQHIICSDAMDQQYERSSRCELRFDGCELGAVQLTFKRSLAPVRWIMEQRGNGCYLEIIDNADSGAIRVFYYSSGRPDVSVERSPDDYFAGVSIGRLGGLYVVSNTTSIGQYQEAVVVPHHASTIYDLQPEPPVVGEKQRTRPQSPAARCDRSAYVLSTITLWHEARRRHDVLSRTIQQNAQAALIDHLVDVMGGVTWQNAEHDHRASRRSDRLIVLARELPSDLSGHVFGRKLIDLVAQLAHASTEECWREFREALVRTPVPALPIDPYYFALLVASCPWRAEPRAQHHLKSMLAYLNDHVELFCCARFLVLALESPDTGRGGFEWDWR